MIPGAEIGELQAVQQRLPDGIDDGIPLQVIVTAACAFGEQILPGAVVSVMLHDAPTATLRLVQSGRFSREYWEAAQQLPVGPHNATCGVAAYRKDVVITADIHQSPDWSAYRQLADNEGFRACWSTPILGREGELLGTFAIYYREPRQPSEREQELLRGLNRLLAVAMRLHQDQDELRQGKHDRLTGLLSRPGFEEELPALCRDAAQRRRAVGLLYLNVDGFSPVNDALGRGVGDQLLSEIGQRLAAVLPDGGLLAHCEADEFVLALPDCGYEQRVDEHAEKVLYAMSERFLVSGHELHVSASVGATICQGAMDGDASAIQRASLAMRQAKQSGRNNWQWYGENMQGSREHIELRRDIQHAMDTDAFRVHYQPLVNARSGDVRTVEALIRWPDPKRGMISPGRFIPVAESTGQIIAMGRQVLFQACGDIARFNARTGRNVAVAVNISPMQFRRKGFIDDVTRALDDAGLEPRLLELEVTEGVLMRSTDEVMETLRKIRGLGVRVVIDDFGTGFSSLSYLRDLPITRLKIDGSFIHDMLTSSASSAIVEGVITMAHRLGLLVVAEGVETPEQRQELVRLNCDLLQGFLFSPAIPLAELENCWFE
ncbi:MAG: GGDEF domain-containing protein [Pseudohongiellaceae bacterium]